MLLCARRQTLTYFTASFKISSKYCTLLPCQALGDLSYSQKTMKYRSANNPFYFRTFTNILHGLYEGSLRNN
jgi:hypothetical protein